MKSSAGAPAQRRAARRVAWIGASAAALGLAVFARALTFGFAYDDTWTIVRNSRLAGPLRPLLRALMAGTATKLGLPDATRPAMVASMWIDRHLFGLRPFGYHAHSLLLYAAVCALGALVLLALTRSAKSALVGGLFFAAAPLHAEVVAAANYREDLLASVGVLGALLLLWWPFPVVSRTASEDAPSSFVTVLAVVSFAVALLSKESAASLVLISAAIVALRWPGRRWFARREATLVALLAVFVAWASWRFGLPSGADDVPRDAAAPLGATLVATARFEVLAVREALFPLDWSPEHTTSGAVSAWWMIAFLALIAGMAWLARRRAGRLPVLGLAIALAASLPSSPLAGPANRHADRYFFLAVLGGALVWGVLTTRAARRLRAAFMTRAGHASAVRMARAWYGWLPGAVVLPLVVVAQYAVSPWKDDATLWSVAVERAPESPRAWAALSRVRRLQGELDSADEAVAHALTLEPRYAPARLTRIYNRLARGDVDAARAEIDELLVAGPHPEGFEMAVGCAAGTPDEARACVVAASRDPE
jgi:hypothetical protein